MRLTAFEIAESVQPRKVFGMPDQNEASLLLQED